MARKKTIKSSFKRGKPPSRLKKNPSARTSGYRCSINVTPTQARKIRTLKKQGKL